MFVNITDTGDTKGNVGQKLHNPKWWIFLKQNPTTSHLPKFQPHTKSRHGIKFHEANSLKNAKDVKMRANVTRHDTIHTSFAAPCNCVKCVWHGPEKKHTLELKHEAKQIFFHLFQIMCDHKKTLKCTIQLKSLHKSEREREVKICAWIQNLLSLIIAMHYIGTAKFPP